MWNQSLHLDLRHLVVPVDDPPHECPVLLRGEWDVVSMRGQASGTCQRYLDARRDLEPKSAGRLLESSHWRNEREAIRTNHRQVVQWKSLRSGSVSAPVIPAHS
jgi:hypothetical protein